MMIVLKIFYLKENHILAGKSDIFKQINSILLSYLKFSFKRLPIMDNTYVFLNEVYSYQLDYSIIKSVFTLFSIIIIKIYYFNYLDTNNNSLKYKKMN